MRTEILVLLAAAVWTLAIVYRQAAAAVSVRPNSNYAQGWRLRLSKGVHLWPNILQADAPASCWQDRPILPRTEDSVEKQSPGQPRTE